MARPEGFEPPIFRIGICCAIQLRHGRVWLLCCELEYYTTGGNFFQLFFVEVLMRCGFARKYSFPVWRDRTVWRY